MECTKKFNVCFAFIIYINVYVFTQKIHTVIYLDPLGRDFIFSMFVHCTNQKKIPEIL